MDQLVPAGTADDEQLRRALAADAARRLGRTLGTWRRLDGAPPDRRSFAGVAPASGRFRTWLAEVEDALAMAEAAGAHDLSRLVDVVADAGSLAALAPAGRIPKDFTARVRREARARLAASARAIPGLVATTPEFGAVLVERGLRIVDAGRSGRFERRVAKAMTLLDAAWPESAAMIRARVWRIVPVKAWGTVSYSSGREPGVVYVDADSAPLLRLAEDLVHETVHVRVHELESLHPLVAARGEGARYYSPWRREWRPLRGLVHAVCTFTAGAMYFERMLGAKAIRPARRRWLARRLLEERAAVASALPALEEGSRLGLLSASGTRVVAAAAREHRALARRAAARRRWLSRTREGRAELVRVDRLVTALAKRPVRWSWA
jgi:hypothetical protein